MKDKQTFKRILRTFGPHAYLLAISLFFAVVQVACTLLIPVLVGKCVDLFVGKDAVDFRILYRYLAYLGGLTALGAVAQFVLNVANNRLTFLSVMDLRNELIGKLQRLSLSYFDAKPSGEIVGNMVNDAEALSDGVLLALTQLFTGVLTIAGTLVLMFLFQPVIAGVVVLLTPLSLFIAGFITKRTRQKFAEQAKCKAEQTSFIEDSVTNHKTIKAYSREEEMEKRYAEMNERMRQVSLSATFYSSLPNPTTRFVNSLVYASVALIGGLCCVGVISVGGALTAGGLASLLSYAGQYAKPFNEITGVIAEFQASVVGAKRVFALLDGEEDVPDENGEEVSGDGNVEIQNASFSYDKSRTLLKGLNVSVEKGQHIAIVGPTGCGKTTLINLLVRFYDVDEGAIVTDGVNIKNAQRKSLRRSYGMVLQESWIRKATVRENLTLGNNIPEEEIINAAKICKSDAFIRTLENGYDTVINEDSLSQGQKQLLCITRVMLLRSKRLILDEATSAVDVRTERNINEAFDLLMKGKTAFVVAHRLSTIRHSDRILVMKDGNVIEQGTHEELLKKGGFYKELYRSSIAVR